MWKIKSKLIINFNGEYLLLKKENGILTLPQMEIPTGSNALRINKLIIETATNSSFEDFINQNNVIIDYLINNWKISFDNEKCITHHGLVIEGSKLSKCGNLYQWLHVEEVKTHNLKAEEINLIDHFTKHCNNILTKEI